ncbi:MAG: S-layer homology domain-containing protein [Slackia sp.]|nr:S-layer homology domain-containing protein [Slackia sp.]
MRKETRFFKAGAGRAACAALLAGSLAMPATAFAAAGFPDSDVVPGAWYVGHVQEAVDAGIVRGYPDGTFRPEEGVTRAQVAEMLCRAQGAALPEGVFDAENETPWSDVAGSMWYTRAMNWAYANGVFTGDGDGTTTVRPDDGISREEMAKVVASYVETFRGADVSADGLAWPEGTSGADELSAWAEPYFLWLANEGVMGGHVRPDGTSYLDAKGATTRAQFAKLAVKASAWEPGQGGGGEEALEIARVEAYDVTQGSAAIRAFSADGRDITAECEFAIGSRWQDSPVLDGLAADTEYTAHVRVARVGDRPAGPVADVTFRTLAAQGGGEEQKAEAPAEIEVRSIGQTSFGVRATDADGMSVNLECEFRIDGGEWTKGSRLGVKFTGLTPDTEYTVYARTAAHDGLAASDAISKTVRTQAEQGDKPSADAVWVTEYTPQWTTTCAVNGTGSIDGVYDVLSEGGVHHQTEEMKKLAQARLDLGLSMEDLDAPFNEDWDTVSGDTFTTVWALVKTGGHWETPKSEAERQKLYSYNETEAKDFPTTVQQRPVTYVFTCADGRTYSSKKAAFNSGSKIVRWEYGNDRNTKQQTHDLAKLIREAGGTPGEAWCYTGETLQTMDGSHGNQ